jgi:dTDP-4-dehydrorhamnose 3,5-epimerase
MNESFVTATELEGVLLIRPRVFVDSRGFFLETHQETRYHEAGVLGPFVQDNHSRSRKGVVRGLHYQLKRAQGKLITVIRGAVFDVAVDIRRGSPTFGCWTGQELSDTNHVQLYIPPGFAHGFSVLSAEADVVYKCTDYYTPGDEFGILWSDPDLAIDWRVGEGAVLSAKDAELPCLRDLAEDRLPVF